MSEKQHLVIVPDALWQNFKRVSGEVDEDELAQQLALVMLTSAAEYVVKWEESHPYQTLPVPGGWNIFFCQEGKEPRLSDVHPEPFPPDRKANADRLRKSKNRKWWKALRETEEKIKQEGALIF